MFQPDAGSYYTAWSSASSLVAKGLMIRKSHPPKYSAFIVISYTEGYLPYHRFSLSDTGASLAIRLLQQSEGSKSGSQPNSSVSAHNCASAIHSPPSASTSQLSVRKRHGSGSPSRSHSSPAKKNCSSPRLDLNTDMQSPPHCIILGER